MGDNGKKLDIEKIEKNMPIVSGSKNINNIFKVINLLKLSKFRLSRMTKINFLKVEDLISI